MTNLPRPRSRTPATAYDHSPPRRAGAVHPSLDLTSEGVVAGYIHDISIRHRHQVSAPRPRHELDVSRRHRSRTRHSG
jgi:hypothetical protein